MITTQEQGTTTTQNAVNYIGVYARPSGNYQARLRVGLEVLTLGTYPTKEEASDAYFDNYVIHNNGQPPEPISDTLHLTAEQAAQRVFWQRVKAGVIWNEQHFPNISAKTFTINTEQVFRELLHRIETNRYHLTDAGFDLYGQVHEALTNIVTSEMQEPDGTFTVTSNLLTGEPDNTVEWYIEGWYQQTDSFSPAVWYITLARHQPEAQTTSVEPGKVNIVTKVVKAIYQFFRSIFD